MSSPYWHKTRGHICLLAHSSFGATLVSHASLLAQKGGFLLKLPQCRCLDSCVRQKAELLEVGEISMRRGKLSWKTLHFPSSLEHGHLHRAG